MAENLENSGNVQENIMASENPAAEGEEYEYEYIELAEGEELPEDAEYEYVEVVDDSDVAQQETAVETAAELPEPILSVPPMSQQNVSVPETPNMEKIEEEKTSQENIQPLSQPVQEADLNALLDDDGEIQEVNASTLLDGDYSDDFARNLFENKEEAKVEEVSLDEILGSDVSVTPAGIEDVKEVSPEELVAGIARDDDGSLRKSIWADLTDDEPISKETETEKFLYNEAGEKQQITEEVIVMSQNDEVVHNDNISESEVIVSAEPVVVLTEPVVEEVVAEAEPAVAPTEPVVEEVVAEAEPVVAPAEPVVEEVVAEAEPVVAPAEPVVEEVVAEAEPVVAPAEAVVEEVVAEAEPVVAPAEPVVEEVVAEAEPAVAPTEPVVEEVVAEPEPVVVPTEAVVEEVVAEAEPVVAPVEPEINLMEAEDGDEDVYVADAKEPYFERKDYVASETLKDSTETVSSEFVQVAYQAISLTEEQHAEMLAKDCVVDKNSGLQFFDLSGGNLLLNVDDVQELDDWHLIIFNQNIVSVEQGKKFELVQPCDTIRRATVVKQGIEKLDIFNEEEYQFENPKDNFLTAKKHFIYGKAEDDTGLIVNDFVNIGLRSNVGKILNFENPVFGWLSGPQGAQIYVARLGKMAVFVPKDTRVDEDAAKKNALNWLSGSEDDKYFEFSGASQSTEFVGNDDIKNIHVNVGTSAYGWNVSFDNGVTMSLRDLQEFEGKHGKMPSENGEISHGPLKLKFSNVEKIVVYQTPQYFGYGRK